VDQQDLQEFKEMWVHKVRSVPQDLRVRRVARDQPGLQERLEARVMLDCLDQPVPQDQPVKKVVQVALDRRARLVHPDRPVCQAHGEVMDSQELLEPQGNRDRKGHRDRRVSRETEVKQALPELPDRLDRMVHWARLEQRETRAQQERPVLLVLQVVRVHQGCLGQLVLLDHQDLLELPDLVVTRVLPDLLDHRDRLDQEDLQVPREVLEQLVTMGPLDQLDLLVLWGRQAPLERKEKRGHQERRECRVHRVTMVHRAHQVK